MIPPRSFARKLGSLAPAASTFLMGAGALILFDIVVARFAPAADLDDWASLKSYMFGLSAVALMGLDQAIVREPSKFNRLVKPALVMIVLLAALAAAAAWGAGLYRNGFVLFAAAAVIAASTLFFGVLRGRCLFGAAHIARDGWKVLLLLLVWPAYFLLGVPIAAILLVSLALSFGVSALALARPHPGLREIHDEIDSLPSALAVSWPLWLASIALAVATYGELMLVSAFGTAPDVAYYFRSLILFTYPSIIGNTFFATVSVPYIRNSPVKYSRLLVRYRWGIAAAILLAPAAALLAGVVLAPLLAPGYVVDYTIAILLSLASALRIAHTLIASFVTALAPSHETRSYALSLFAFACITPLLCWALIAGLGEVGVAVALAALIHWVLRALAGLRLLRRNLARHNG